jgi:hypothetical protein
MNGPDAAKRLQQVSDVFRTKLGLSLANVLAAVRID